MLDKIKPHAKAIGGFVAAAVASALASRGVDTEGGILITGGEWLEAGLTGLGAAAVVWFTPNKDPEARHQRVTELADNLEVTSLFSELPLFHVEPAGELDLD